MNVVFLLLMAPARLCSRHSCKYYVYECMHVRRNVNDGSIGRYEATGILLLVSLKPGEFNVANMGLGVGRLTCFCHKDHFTPLLSERLLALHTEAREPYHVYVTPPRNLRTA